MTNHTKQAIEEFEKLSKTNHEYYQYEGMLVGCDNCGGNLDKESVKTFLQTKLDQAYQAGKQDALEKLEQIRLSYVQYEEQDYTAALEDAIQAIKGVEKD